MQPLRYLQAYPPQLQDQVRQLIEQDRLGEGPADGEDRRSREVQLTLAIAVDVAGEPVIPQPGDGVGVEETLHHRDLGVAEPEPCQLV